jgi:hypothetical protein
LAGSVLRPHADLATVHLLDAARYLVVWNPLAFLVLRVVFWEAGIPMS